MSNNKKDFIYNKIQSKNIYKKDNGKKKLSFYIVLVLMLFWSVCSVLSIFVTINSCENTAYADTLPAASSTYDLTYPNLPFSVTNTSLNLIPFPYTSTSAIRNGLEFDINNDGSIRLFGVTTAITYFYFVPTSSSLTLENGVTYYILSDYIYFVYDDSNSVRRYITSHFTWSDNYTFVGLYMQIPQGITFDAFTYYPLLSTNQSAIFTPPIDILYNSGYSSGQSYGENIGYQNGLQDGLEQGYQNGLTDGRLQGINESKYSYFADCTVEYLYGSNRYTVTPAYIDKGIDLTPVYNDILVRAGNSSMRNITLFIYFAQPISAGNFKPIGYRHGFTGKQPFYNGDYSAEFDVYSPSDGDIITSRWIDSTSVGNGFSIQFGTGQTSTGVDILDFTINSIENWSIQDFSSLQNCILYDASNSAVFYNQGYQVGKSDGLTEGELIGFDKGFDEGYQVGKNAGYNQGLDNANNYTFISLLGAVVDAPIQAISGLLNFNILGMNMSNFFFGLMTIGLIIFIIRLFI